MALTLRCLVILFSSIFVSALPVSSPDSNGTSLIAVTLVVLFAFVSLVVMKRLYLQKRRIESIHAISSQVPAPSRQSSASDSFGSMAQKPLARTEGSGFLVGMFGSPEWETKIVARIDKAVWNQHRSSISSNSESCRQSQTEQSGEVASGTRHSSPSALSENGTVQASAVSEQAGPKSPTICSSPPIGTNDEPKPSQVRLVRKSSGHDTPLPLSPKDATAREATLPNKLFKSRFIRKPIPSLVPLAPRSPLDGLSQPISTSHIKSISIQAPRPVYISRPYPLAPRSTQRSSVSAEPQPSAPKAPKIVISAPMRKPFEPIKPQSAIVPVEPQPVHSHSPLLTSYAFPLPPPESPATLARQKKKPRRPSRRVSSVGPSPLRTMILPEESSESIQDKENRDRSKDSNNISSDTSHSSNLQSSMGETSSTLGNSSNSSDRSQVSANTPRRVYSTRTDDGSNMLLDIIRVLVEEGHYDKDLQNSPKSVDLGLLGLDRFKLQENDEKRKSRTPEDSLLELISFWEEEPRWTDDEDRRESVGMAW